MCDSTYQVFGAPYLYNKASVVHKHALIFEVTYVRLIAAEALYIFPWQEMDERDQLEGPTFPTCTRCIKQALTPTLSRAKRVRTVQRYVEVT